MNHTESLFFWLAEPFFFTVIVLGKEVIFLQVLHLFANFPCVEGVHNFQNVLPQLFTLSESFKHFMNAECFLGFHHTSFKTHAMTNHH